MQSNTWVDILFSALARQEGAYDPDPNVIPRRRHNPLDLRYAGQIGASRPGGAGRSGGVEPIAQFDTEAHGITAGYRQIWIDIARGESLRSLVYSWAPPSENDTAVYLANVSKWTGITDVDKPLLSFLVLPTPPSDHPAT
jgi:hypothetical protein